MAKKSKILSKLKHWLYKNGLWPRQYEIVPFYEEQGYWVYGKRPVFRNKAEILRHARFVKALKSNDISNGKEE